MTAPANALGLVAVNAGTIRDELGRALVALDLFAGELVDTVGEAHAMACDERLGIIREHVARARRELVVLEERALVAALKADRVERLTRAERPR